MSSIFGLVGESISYSLSPAIHNASARHLGLDASYGVYSMPATKVESFLDRMWIDGALGFNVTQPHKRLAAAITSNHQLSSVNTLYRGKTGWLSASTDGKGFANALVRVGKPIEHFERVVMIGAGGAVFSLLEHLSQAHFKGLVVVASRATPPRGSFKNLSNISPVCIQLHGSMLAPLVRNRSECLLVQGTSAPLRGDDLSQILPALTDFQGTYFDMVYGHDSAPLKFCMQRGLTALDGIPMLIEQAREAQKLWWGKAADYELIADTLRRLHQSSAKHQ